PLRHRAGRRRLLRARSLRNAPGSDRRGRPRRRPGFQAGARPQPAEARAEPGRPAPDLRHGPLGRGAPAQERAPRGAGGRDARHLRRRLVSLAAPEVSGCRALLLDVDGCLVLSDRPGGEGGQVLPGAAELLDRLRETDRRYVLFTNASSLPPDDLASSLRAVGLAVDGSQVITPSVVAADYLAERHASRPVLAFGGSGVVEPLRARGVELLALEEHERAAAVLVGGDPEFGHRKLDAAARAVTRGAELLVTSTSRWFAGRGGRQVGVAAAIAAGITYVTGVEARVVGKPSPLALR